MLRHAAPFALPFALALGVAAAPNAADAKARYMGLEEAVERSDVIALVHTEATAACEVTGEHWTYHQKVFAKPTRVLKGELDSPFELLAQKDFICASVSYDAAADYVVLLRREGEHLTTVNHHMGALRLRDDHVEWPYGEEESLALPEAVDQLQALIGAAPPEEQPPAVDPDPEAREPESEPRSEPQPCGYAVSRLAEQEEAAARQTWIIGGAVAGAAAVLLGFVVGFRRRRKA